MKISTRTVLQADEGMILTDGTAYGRTIMLAEGRTAEEFYEITEEEHSTIMAQEAENTSDESANQEVLEEAEEDNTDGNNS